MRIITKNGSDDAEVILQVIDGVCLLGGAGISMKRGLLCLSTYFHFLMKYYF